MGRPVRVVLAEPDAVVVDDVLEPAAFSMVQHELARGRFISVHANGWDKAWRLGDGSPMRGAPVYFDPTGSIDRPGVRHPTFTVVDEFIDVLRDLASQHPQVVGREGNDWLALFLAPWLYPVGSALSLHRDGGAYSGAFTYFAHPQWGVHWGGELLLLRDDPGLDWPTLGATGWMTHDEAGLDVGTCIFPRPNRLVLVGPTRPHLITRVDVNAGDRVRTSLAGFFLRS